MSHWVLAIDLAYQKHVFIVFLAILYEKLHKIDCRDQKNGRGREKNTITQQFLKLNIFSCTACLENI